MEVTTQPSVNVLYSRHETTITQLGQFVGQEIKALAKEIVENNAMISGPQFWIYHGMDGKPDTVFTLDIAVPFQGEIKSTRFKTKQLPAFKALKHTHRGPWEQLPGAYGQVMGHIQANKIPISEEVREVYLNVDFIDPTNNVTEIQLGVI